MKPALPHHNLVGREVGAERWPHYGSHPECWATPHKGIVLEIDDPRAWAGTIAFPMPDPDRDAIRAHIEKCISKKMLTDRVPVLWDFPHEKRVLWESTDRLVDYREDLARWQKAREKAYQAAIPALG